MEMITLPKPLIFAWDKGNNEKNWKKHKVNNSEAEEVFFDAKKRAYKDIRHSIKEERYLMLGKTKKGRALFIVFTVRGRTIRIISARDVNKKEHIAFKIE